MRLIHISPFFLPKLGGMQNVAREISERLAKEGHQVEVFTSNVGCPKNKQLKSTKNLKIHYLPGREFSNTAIIPSLYKELMKIPQDSIFHVHVAQAYVPEIVYRVCKKRNIPYIAQVHIDAEPSSLIGRIFLKHYKKIFLKRFLKKAQKIIVLTEDYKKLISKKYSINKNKIRVIPNGIGNGFYVNRAKKTGIPRLLYVGRISSQKNPKMLIDSISLCESKFMLDIVGGKTSLSEELEALVKRNNIKNVIFHGKKVGDELIKIYQNSDIFISTTNQESFGITYLEAMASGLPIITSNIPAVRNVVKNGYNGILCKQTPEAFAETIDKLIENPKLREKLARNGLKEVKKYSWDKIVEQTEKVYEEVLKEHNKKLKQKKK